MNSDQAAMSAGRLIKPTTRLSYWLMVQRKAERGFREWSWGIEGQGHRQGNGEMPKFLGSRLTE